MRSLKPAPGKPPLSRENWLKVDLHLHCAEDLQDAVTFSAEELLRKAHRLGFSALAFTLHNCFFTRPELDALARKLGVLLIRGIELRLDGADVVVLNLTEAEAHGIASFADLRKLRERRGEGIFVFAPHPFYRFGGSIGKERLLQELDLFDAIEQCHFHTRLIDPNRPAAAFARKYGKPLIATSDAHRLSRFGRHYTLVEPPAEGPLTAESLFRALRCGRSEMVSPAQPLWRLMSDALWILAVHDLRVRLERA